MVEPAKKVLQAAVIDAVRKKNRTTYTEIANSIDVHCSHIQKVATGVRLLSDDKFQQLCNIWNVDITDLVKKVSLTDMEYLRWKTLLKLIEARKVDFKELGNRTGITPLILNRIERGKHTPTKEEMDKLVEVLNVDSQILEEGRIIIALEIIEKVLDSLLLAPSAIKAVLDFVEEEM